MSVKRHLGIYAVVLLVVGLIVFVVQPQSKDEGGDDDEAAGFDDLRACAELTSLDSTRSLSLTSDHKARFSDKSGLAVRWQAGTWELVDDDAHLYRITLGDIATDYVLASAPEGEGCMLAAGKDPAVVDLNKSWYSTLTDPK